MKTKLHISFETKIAIKLVDPILWTPAKIY